LVIISRTPRRSTARRSETHADGFPVRRVGFSVEWWEFRAARRGIEQPDDLGVSKVTGSVSPGGKLFGS